MKKFLTKRKSKQAFGDGLTGNISQFIRIAAPVIAYVLISIELAGVAFAVVIILKWRVLAVRFRYWGINLRTNMVDILASVSFVQMMTQTDGVLRIIWLVLYIAWVAYLRNQSKSIGMVAQAVVVQMLAVSALLAFNRADAYLWVIVIGVWAISYFSARHVISAYGSEHGLEYAVAWSLIAIQVAWVMGHWQIWFGPVHQMVILLGTLFTGLSIIYGLSQQEKVKVSYISQISASMAIITLLLILLSDWQESSLY